MLLCLFDIAEPYINCNLIGSVVPTYGKTCSVEQIRHLLSGIHIQTISFIYRKVVIKRCIDRSSMVRILKTNIFLRMVSASSDRPFPFRRKWSSSLLLSIWSNNCKCNSHRRFTRIRGQNIIELMGGAGHQLR